MRPARWTLCLLLLLAIGSTWAQPLPPEIESALERARLPSDAVVLLVAPADGRGPPRLSYRADVPVNPASIAKLATTIAGLDLLGPAFTWRTPIYLGGPVQGGTLQGDLYIKGSGDPKLVAEQLWLLLRRVQGLGIRFIAGDIVLDRSAFETAASDPGAFDGEPQRPYNAAPDALLVNFKSMVLTFTPVAGQVRVHAEPPLAGVRVPLTVPARGGACNDWRAGLLADFADPAQIRFAGSYPLACGERAWPVAAADPAGFAAR
ncbi:MAG TPA: D-alanyl-D-alanine carboxypeptidase, partial [Ramlibacter sp.]|nr:D-alanyl-D-alanine carboxypeptidase [Ramlibacter sp.]